MRIIHNISANGNHALKADLDREGISYEYEETDIGNWVRLRVGEDDSCWARLEDLVQKHIPLDSISVEYTDLEIREADWCQLGATGHFGYPQPEDGYVEATYCTDEYRATCGIGAVQRDRFRLRSEPPR